MSLTLRIPEPLFQSIHEDLNRAHDHAAERVGFLLCGTAKTLHGDQILAGHYHPVADHHYLKNQWVGASIGPDAFREVMQLALANRATILHVHRHEHYGPPAFSRVDLEALPGFIPGFRNVCPSVLHGAVVFSRDAATGMAWRPGEVHPTPLAVIQVIGRPCRIISREPNHE